MTLKQAIKEHFELDLPISGGDGSSAEEAIVVENTFYLPHELEEFILENYYTLKGYPWKQLMKNLERIDGKPMDVIKVGFVKNNNTYVQDWYFDLSKCDLF